jgi:hypothetical protein
MSTAVGTPVNEALKTIALVIVGVAPISALIGWAMWRSGQHAERVERDPVYLRKTLRRGAYLYISVAAIGTALVLVGDQPKESLFGLPIALLLIWFFFYSARKVKAPPK